MELKIFWSTLRVEGAGRAPLRGYARPALILMGDWRSDDLTPKPGKIQAQLRENRHL
jgi:hypothetical protein